MDLLPGALVVQQQQMTQRRDQQNALDHEAAPRPRRGRTRRAVRRGLGHALIAAGTALVRWAEPLPARPAQPSQQA